VPGAAVLAGMSDRVPAGIARSWVWEGLIVAHEAWALLAMACLLVAMRACVSSDTGGRRAE
jgi:hypothetical protein